MTDDTVYALVIRPAAERVIRKLPREQAKRVKDATEALRTNPRPNGAIALQGRLRGYLRIRIGDYRVIYIVEDHRLVVSVTEIRPRDQSYSRRVQP